MLLALLYFLSLRFLDDYQDYYQDRIQGKALFPRGAVFLLSLLLMLGEILTLAILEKWFFFLPVALFLIVAFWKNKYLKIFILPCVIFSILFSEFEFHYSMLISLSLSLILGILFHFRKKEKYYSIEQVGGKAYQLLKLKLKNTPRFIVIPSDVLLKEEYNKVKDMIADFCKKNKLYAVRSSAIDEDSLHHSFAGIHDSYLNVEYIDIFDAVIRVKESATSPRAMEYRIQNQLPLDNIAIAVIIQEMVDADYAGVINTINPITNNFNEIVLSVCKGLGEDLVNGTKDGTTYYIHSDQVKVVGEDILSKAQLKSLTRLTAKVIAKTDRFQDIEFAMIDSKAHFLQARPITTYKDINPHKMTLLLDNSNIIESYYGITSPLTFSFAKDIYEKVYTETLQVGKVRKKILNGLKPSLSNMLYSYEGKIYYNLKSWYHVSSIFPSKKSLQYMESMMGVKDSNQDYKRVKLNLFDILKILGIFIKKVKNMDELSETFLKNFNEIVKPYYGKEITGNNQELKALYLEIEKKIIPEFTTPILNDCAVMFYFGRLKEKTKKYPKAETLLNQAISNHGDVESIHSAKEFEYILQYIKNNPTIYLDFQNLSIEALSEKYFNETEFGMLLRKYIETYGSRVINELKLETITMIEEPTMLLEQLKFSLEEKKENPFSLDFYEEIPAKLFSLSKKTKHYIQNRERLRMKRTYIFSVVRNIFLAYGRNLASAKEIDSPRDVFYLTKEEILENASNKKELIEQRKKEYQEYESRPYYDRIAFFEDKILPIKSSNQNGTLRGIPSGAGVIRAHVSKMETSKDTLKQGNLILTKRTDPGWISLFPLASGLIIEHGSMLSHSFVVARELGLPAVVGVEGATQIIENNALVLLDGVEGVISLEEK